MADIPVKIYRSSTVRPGTSPSNPGFPADEEPVIENPAGTPVSTYKTLGDTLDKTFVGKNGFTPIVVNENELQLVPLPQIQENGLISGGIVQWTGSGYVFNGSGAFYRIAGNAYSSDPTQVTLAAPDPTNDRIDVFAVDVNSDLIVITGTPAATPVKPQVDPSIQLELTSVIVTAASTDPILTEEVIYDENTEWTGSSSGTGTANFASAVDPFQGSVSIETTSIQNGFQVILDNGSDIDISTFQTFGFQIKLKANLGAGQNIQVVFLDSANVAISNVLVLPLNKSLTSDYQFIGIVLSGMNFTTNLVRKVRFNYVRTSGGTTYTGYFLDIIKLEGGINPPVTVGLSGAGTAGEIAYFTASTALASLPVSTYPSLAELAHVKGVTSAIQGQINGKNAALGTNINDALTGAASPSSGNVFATMADIGGGGADTNAVHYNAADAKTATEKQRARDNIGSPEGITSNLPVTSGGTNNFAKISNIIEATGSDANNLSGVVAGTDGELLLIISRMTSNVFTVLNESAGSVAANRFSIGANYIFTANEGLLFRYDGLSQRWVFAFFGYSGLIRNAFAQSISPGATTLTVDLLTLEADSSSGRALINLSNLKSTAGAGYLKARNHLGTILYNFLDTAAIVPETIITANAALTVTNQRTWRDTTITTAGAINNLAIADRTYHFIGFTGALPDLTGIVTPGTNVFTRITIHNRSGGNMTLRHESASSTAANRFKIIGAADLTVPNDGIVDLQRTRNARWEIASKNF